MVIVIAASVGGWGTPALAQRARVPQTGQTQCWDVAGSPTRCDGTGQDGDIQAGVDWPTPRFTNNRNGTVTDKLTGLVWLKNANCFGVQTWQNALNAANTLEDDPASTTTDCGHSDGSKAGDWRLPNVKELQSLIDFGTFDPALPSGHPFSGVQSTFYWSSTTFVGSPAAAWDVSLHDGVTTNDFKDGGFFLVWPVRGER
jgi:hypothetical protein